MTYTNPLRAFALALAFAAALSSCSTSSECDPYLGLWKDSEYASITNGYTVVDISERDKGAYMVSTYDSEMPMMRVDMRAQCEGGVLVGTVPLLGKQEMVLDGDTLRDSGSTFVR